MIEIPQGTEPLLINIDCRDGLAALPAGSVHCVITSPPYWRTRDYGLGPDQLGLEATPQEYVQNLVSIFREVRRVLRDDGTLWLNLGDCYAGRHTRADGGRELSLVLGIKEGLGLKPKDLVGIPWLVAFALREDGWYLRSDVVWAKAASLGPFAGRVIPEPISDRPTRSHEYVFLFTKSSRNYYDRWGSSEETSGPAKRNTSAKMASANPFFRRLRWSATPYRETYYRRSLRTVWTLNPDQTGEYHFATFPVRLVGACLLAGCPRYVCPTCNTPWRPKVTRESAEGLRISGSKFLIYKQACGCEPAHQSPALC